MKFDLTQVRFNWTKWVSRPGKSRDGALRCGGLLASIPAHAPRNHQRRRAGLNKVFTQ